MSKYIERIPLEQIGRIQAWYKPKGLTLAEALMGGEPGGEAVR